MWNIPDDDGDNIPGVGGNDYPVNGQKELCGLNPTNPGCWYVKMVLKWTLP